VVNSYAVGKNNTIVNNGISHDFVANHTRTEIPKVAVREEARGSGRVIAPDRLGRAGTDLVVYRPTAPPAHAEAALRERQERLHPSPSSSVTRAAASSGISAARPNSATSAATFNRAETARPQVSSRVETPVFARPQPIRPELSQSIAPRVSQNSSIAPHSVSAGNFSAAPHRPEQFAANSEISRPQQPNNMTQFNPGQFNRPQVSQSQASPVIRPEARAVNPVVPRSQAPSISQSAASPNVARPTPRFTPPQELAQPQQARPSVPYPSSNPWSGAVPPGSIANRSEPVPNHSVAVPIQRERIVSPVTPVPVPAPPRTEVARPNVSVPQAAAPVHTAPPPQVSRPSPQPAARSEGRNRNER
jgi:hypothetical protein